MNMIDQDDEPTPLTSVTITFERGDNEHFEFLLHSDGSGIMHDVDYGDKLDIEHELTAEQCSQLLAAATDATIREDDLPDGIPEFVNAIFDEMNDDLENPVGDPPDDRDLELAKGNEHEFNTALAATLYLANLNGIGNGIISFPVDTDDEDGDYRDNELPDELAQIVNAICDAFGPSGNYIYDYVDQNDGRVTSHAKSASNVSIETEEIETYLPSSRERLEARRILKTLLSQYGVDGAVVDATFPPSLTTSTDSEDH